MPKRREARARVGTSGWLYRHWRGVLYPEKLPQREWLAFYVRHFPTVEINATFYRLPTPASVERWRTAAPAGLIYSVKASRLITHLKRLDDCSAALDEFLAVARRLEGALGPVLYQLPPGFKRDQERLEAFARLLPNDLTHVFEFRDESWWTPEIRWLLDDLGAASCIHDHRGMASPNWLTGPIGYWRFHGSGRGPDSGYAEAALARAARKIREAVADGRNVYVCFNNDAYGCAVRDARRLRQLLSGIAA